jgi:hypothetical protein
MNETKIYPKNDECQTPPLTDGIIKCLDRLSELPYPYRMAAIIELREKKGPISQIVEHQHALLLQFREEAFYEMQAVHAGRKAKSKPEARAEALAARYSGDVQYFSDRKIPPELIADFLSKLDKKFYPDSSYVYSAYGVKDLIRKLVKLDHGANEA